jgi:hypothetical protein
MRTHDEADIAIRVQIVGTKNKNLSKNQIAFNKLIQEIESTEANIEATQQKLQSLLEYFMSHYDTSIQDFAKRQYELATLLSSKADSYKLSKQRYEKLRELIVLLCENCFEQSQATQEQISFYEYWAESNSRFQHHSEEIPDDPTENTSDNWEETTHHYDWQDAGSKKGRKKSKKQANKKEKEEVQQRSLRSIYIALAKLLHPDTETDEVLQHQKQEVLKLVTVAYDQKDLKTLLRIELEWVHKTNAQLDRLSDEKLRIYVAALRQQLKELKSELEDLYRKPQYSQVSDLAQMPEKAANTHINNLKTDLKSRIDYLKQTQTYIRNIDSKGEFADFVDVMWDNTLG